MHSCYQIFLVNHASFLIGKEEGTEINRIASLAHRHQEQALIGRY